MNKYLESIIIIITTIIIIKLTKIIFSKINKNKRIHITFLKSILQTAAVIVCIFLVGSNFETFKTVSASIVTGSTLIVAVLAFSLEEGISNIVHGLIISLCKPFDIGDRIVLPNLKITGKVKSITIRHTIIQQYTTNTLIIIPNAVIDKEVIENCRLIDTTYSHYIDISISRDSDISIASEIFKNKIIEDERYVDSEEIYIFVREITDDSIWLRGFISTNTLEENFIACSEIRKNVISEFKKNNINPPLKITKAI